MAKFVIAGKSNCPFYARAEILADELCLRLPDFSVHKIVVDPSEWEQWLSATCVENGWDYEGNSPLVWRELVNRGGKGVLIGSCNDFLEIAKGYYGITCEKTSEALLSVAGENKVTKDLFDDLQRMKLSNHSPFKITLTCPSNAYNLLPHLCSGNMFKEANGISVTLLINKEDDENADQKGLISGLIMEMEDLAQNQLSEVMATYDLRAALSNPDLVIIMNVDTGEVNNEYLLNLKKYAIALNGAVKKTTTIFFAGENAMLDCYIMSQFAPDISKDSFLCMSRFEENKIKSVVAKKLEINPNSVTNLFILGTSREFLVDYESSMVYGYNGAIWAPHLKDFTHSVKDVIYDKTFLDDLSSVLNKKKIPENNNKPTKPLLSFSVAMVSQLTDVIQPTSSNIMYSLGLISQGWYEVPEGIPFSFPVMVVDGKIKVNTDLKMSETVRNKIKSIAVDFEEYLKQLIAEIS